jgi:hypothetical protein
MMDKFNISKMRDGNHFRSMDNSELRIAATKLLKEYRKLQQQKSRLKDDNLRLREYAAGRLQEQQKKEIWRHIKPCPIKAKLNAMYGDLAYLESLIMNTPNVQIDV